MKTVFFSIVMSVLCISLKAQVNLTTPTHLPVLSCGCSTTGWSPTIAYIGATKTSVRCGHQFSLRKDEPIKLSYKFTCSGSCAPKYLFLLKKADGTIIENTSSLETIWSHTFPVAGGYNLTIVPICNGNKCAPCTYYFTVN
jgi:hypothetical protein